MVLYAASRSGLDSGLKPALPNSIRYSKLDISLRESIDSFVARLRQKEGRVDVLINNAGVRYDENDFPAAKSTIAVNFTATMRLCQALLPLMEKGSRIVNLSSVACSLRGYGPQMQRRLRSSKDNMNLEELEGLSVNFLKSVQEGNLRENGWPDGGGSYSVSKALLNALTAVLARENPGIHINACCPGWVSTDMGQMVLDEGKVSGSTPPKSLEDGATIPLRLAIGDIDGVSGQYWANASVFENAAGMVQPW